MFFLIDGYNLALAAGVVRNLDGPGNAERARQRLLDWLRNHLDERQRARTTVVFDARQPTIDRSEFSADGIRVLFAVDYDDADSMIEELIARHSAPRRLTVVSSDLRLKTAARRRRAVAIDSDQWLQEIESISKYPAASASVDEKPGVENAQDFLAEFDPDEIREWIQADRDDGIKPLKPKPKRGNRGQPPGD